MRDFFKKYHVGCWFYYSTHGELGYNPVEAMHDLGMTFATIPEHWHYENDEKCNKTLEGYIADAKRLGMPAIYTDENILTSGAARATEEQIRKRLPQIQEKFGTDIAGLFIADEPYWGYMDGNKALDRCATGIRVVKEVAPEYFPYVSLFGAPKSRWSFDYKVINEALDRIQPEYLFYNVYSQCLAEDFEAEQGVIDFYYQLNLYSQIAKERKLPLWASCLVASCWSFRQPTQAELRWQLNVYAAHGVTGFVWYHLQELERSLGQRYMAPITFYGEKTPLYEALKYENKLFRKTIASKLEGYALEEVYHAYKRFANFKALEFCDDDIIEDCATKYNRHVIISKFKATDGSGKYRIMVTNGSQDKNGHFDIKFRGDYAKYNVAGYGGYLAPGSAVIIDLFDK